jgi:tripartite-type tricarboxylate transporter receptor subunit TctC
MKGTDYIKQLGCDGKRANKSKMINLGLLAGLFLLYSISFSIPTAMAAQEIYPAKDITYICGSKPGGGFDTFARLLAPFVTQHLREVSPGAKGGEVKVKNVAGGGRSKAVMAVNDAKPDGYTIGDFNRVDLFRFSQGAEKLPFDVLKFSFLASFTKDRRVLVSKKNGAKTFAEMVALNKKETLRIASSEVGSSEHIETIWFLAVTGIQIQNVITGGSSGTVGALVRGDADLAVVNPTGFMSLINSGEVNVLATFTPARAWDLPNVPTIIELGYPRCLDLMGGVARNVVGPPKMDPKVKAVMLAAFKKMVVDQEFLSYCKKTGIDIDPAWEKDQEEGLIKYRDAILNNIAVFQKYGL